MEGKKKGKLQNSKFLKGVRKNPENELVLFFQDHFGLIENK